LNEEERQAAPALYRALSETVNTIRSGEQRASVAREAALEVLKSSPLVRVEYLEVVDPEELQPVETIRGPVRIAAAIWIGKTRLIDNVSA
jgi:pantoate--beta-alanine ligase